MPLLPFGFPERFAIEGDDASIDIPASWQGKYVYTVTSAERTYTLTNESYNFSGNACVDIRNDSSSSNNIVLAAGGDFSINVSSELGLNIPPGGVGELKRRGGSNTWDLYGYISG